MDRCCTCDVGEISYPAKERSRTYRGDELQRSFQCYQFLCSVDDLVENDTVCYNNRFLRCVSEMKFAECFKEKSFILLLIVER